jgi:hypothetical protein
MDPGRLDQIQVSTDGDFLRAIAAHTLQRLMEFEVDSLGAMNGPTSALPTATAIGIVSWKPGSAHST